MFTSFPTRLERQNLKLWEELKGGKNPEVVGRFPKWMNLFGRCFGGKAFLDFKHASLQQPKPKKVVFNAFLLKTFVLSIKK